jgi:hypothetical protein
MNTFPHIAKVLETPKENNADEKNLQILRDLVSVKSRKKSG